MIPLALVFAFVGYRRPRLTWLKALCVALAAVVAVMFVANGMQRTALAQGAALSVSPSSYAFIWCYSAAVIALGLFVGILIGRWRGRS